ncbi:transporter [Mycobacterium spongiae]|uniref:Transporter n=1 Tax=Mycobacterium spongiae TaxID=886343 RepID=A0A975JWZ6_9MYCO|nr:transporter [Mycobacterium spongiae]QUR67222.1 transporter [Mycobacterium spongiae]
MNSGTLVGSLIFAAILMVLITVVIALMLRGWRNRAQRQAELLGDLPDVPERVGAATLSTRGMYVGCMLSPAWNELVMAGDLGYRSKSVLSRHPEGIMIQRNRAQPIWIPRESVTTIRTERDLLSSGAGRIVDPNPILTIRWRLSSGAEMDTGFWASNCSEYSCWLDGQQEQEDVA